MTTDAEKIAAYEAQDAELQRWKTWAAHLCPNDHMRGDDARDYILAGLEIETRKAREYDALLAEAAKIQPSAEEIAGSIYNDNTARPLVGGCQFTSWETDIAAAIERERLLGLLRERALRKALEDFRSCDCRTYPVSIRGEDCWICKALNAAPPAPVLGEGD